MLSSTIVIEVRKLRSSTTSHVFMLVIVCDSVHASGCVAQLAERRFWPVNWPCLALGLQPTMTTMWVNRPLLLTNYSVSQKK